MNTKPYAYRLDDSALASLADDSKSDAAFDIRAWLGSLRRRKLTIAAITLIGTFLAYIILDGMTPLYTASVEVLIEGEERQIVEFNSVVEGVALDPSAIGSEVEIFQSRSLAAQVVDTLSLTDDPEFNGTLVEREPTLLDRIDPRNWLPRSWLLAIGLVSDNNEQIVETPEETAARIRGSVIDAYLGRLMVEAVSFTYVLTINFTSEYPDKAARIANATAEIYVLQQLESKFVTTQQANTWLGERLESLRQDVIAADNALTSYQTQYSLGGADRDSLIERQLDDANGQLMAARADRAEAEARLQQMRYLISSSGPASVGAVLESGMIQGLRTREAEARRELAELSTRYGDLHPEIINIKAEIEDLQRTINEEVDKVLQNLANDVDIARAREASINQSVSNLTEQFNAEQSAEVGRLQLERQAEAARDVYDTMLARFKEVSEQQDIQQPDARIISAAVASNRPSWPKTKLFVGIAFVVSLAIGVGVAALIELMKIGFRNLEQAEKELDLPGLCEIPIHTGLFRSNPLGAVLKNQISGFAESVRSLSIALMLSEDESSAKVIALASPLSDEGKSTVAIALARLMASENRNVLLIDGDLRKSHIHRVLGIRRSPGLAEVLADGVPLLDAVTVDTETRLHVLPAGTARINPQDLLQSPAAKATLQRLRDAYDIVIVDTPAVLPVSDGLLLSHMADKTLFLVRWEKTPRHAAVRALHKLRQSGIDVAGVVLTRVDRKKQACYGYPTDAYYYGRY